MLVFQNVSFAYGPDGPPALSGVSFELAPGAMLAVVGANGSGKSTLARLCDGLLLPGSGRVAVDGIDTADAERVYDVRELVGLILQDPDDQIVGTLVEEDVAFGPENLRVPAPEIRRRVDAALAAVGLTGKERREPHTLSEGQKQRLAIAGALAMEPRYLVCDEPTALLDPKGRREVAGILDGLAHGGGRGVLHVTHDLTEVMRADTVLALEAGRCAYLGAPEGLAGDAALLERVGLAMPVMGTLAAELRRLGRDVPMRAMDADGVVSALWP